MKDGLIKVASSSPYLKVADCVGNARKIIEEYNLANAKGVKLVVFPELSVTTSNAGELFRNKTLLCAATNAVLDIKAATKGCDTLAVVGFPFSFGASVYNCAAVISNGSVLGIVPKTTVSCFDEYSDARFFAPAPSENTDVFFGGEIVSFGAKQIFICEENSDFSIGVEFADDLNSVRATSCELVLSGATVIACLSASSELVGRAEKRREAVKVHSGKTISAYIYSNASMGNSSADCTYSGHSIIAENGKLLAEGEPFKPELLITDIDVQVISHDRMKNTSFKSEIGVDEVYFSQEQSETEIVRSVPKNPFIPSCMEAADRRCSEILAIQANALARRVLHVNARNIVVGISGGLDSCLALLVMAEAMDILKRSRKDVIAVTLPCFGTTKRTKSNAEKMCAALEVTFKEVNISKAVTQHFEDIGQDIGKYDVTFENAQARERTQVLMDIANQNGGIVVGTGDLSELALGWATYNGDHMSMYGVNASVPKTVIRRVVQYYADNLGKDELKSTLYDILGTPVSPELIPPKDGKISQITEDLVGPYELHDFFLYYFVRYGFTTEKIYRLAKHAFGDEYSDDTVRKWLNVFMRRFVTQQFKRSCSPDGPRVGSVALSTTVWKMPSDVDLGIWNS